MEPLRPEDPRQIGSYLLLARIGAGGMGEVFLGRSPGGRAVAIKVIFAALANDPEFRARFRREVTTARTVTGPFTASLIDADAEAAPPWLATTYLPGLSLQDAIAAYGPWPPPAVCLLGASLAEALQSIHRAGVVHRDLKPSNILLTPEGPRVIDFGIARAADAGTITQTGMAVGSPSYMAPEQATGGDTGPPGDVFALGAVLTYAATGMPPFGVGAVPQLVYRVIHEQPYLGAVVDPWLRDLIAGCLDKDPDRRPTPVQLLERLAHPQPAGPAGPAAPVGPPASAGPPPLFAAPAGVPQGVGWLPPPIAAAIVQRANVPLPPQPVTQPSGAQRKLGRRALLIGGAATVATLAVAGTGAALWSHRPRSPLLWTFDVPDFLGVGPKPAGDAVLVSGSETFALDARTGKVRWRASDKIARESQPVAQDGRVLIYDGSSLTALSIATGQTLWGQVMKSFVLDPVPTVMNGVACMTTSLGTGEYVLEALDVATGQERWKYECEDILQTNAAAANGIFYLGSGRELMYAVDAGGRLRWQEPVGSKVVTTPAVAGDVVVIVTQTYEVIAFDATTGKRRWRNTSDLLRSSGSGPRDEQPIIAAGNVYVRGRNSQLRALNASTGKDRWEFAIGDKAGDPVAVRDLVFVHDGKSTLFALDAATGRARWTHQVETGTGDQPRLMNGTLYLGTTDGVLGLDPPTGRVTFQLGESDFPDVSWVYVESLIASNGVLYCAMGTDQVCAIRTDQR
ncbi:MAG TPA: serine/threonine-protein kinase [Streptosporangiaceae bacterium]